MTEPKIKMPKKSVVERRQQVLEVLISLLNSEGECSVSLPSV